MKIKLDFITNSSSASFCIFGINLPIDLSKNNFWCLKDKIIEKFKDDAPEVLKYPEDYIESYMLCLGLDVYDSYIGYDVEKLNKFNDTATLSDIKKEICEKIKEIDMNIEECEIKFITGEYMC